MTLPKQKFREILFQILYSTDFTGEMDDGILSFLMVKLKISRKNLKEAFEKVRLIQPHLVDIDQRIQKNSHSYEFERISRIEKNILRLGIYEIFYDEVPAKIAISEAIRLCRKFSAPEGAKFINAILDAEYKNSIQQVP